MNVKQLREKYGLSQQDLSDATGIPKGRINAWEQRNTTPKVKDFNTLKAFFENFKNDTVNYFGLNIKGIREHWGLSQSEFGYIIGATRGMVMQYEKRGSMPKDETVSNIVEITGISKDILTNTKLKRNEYPEISQDLLIEIENYRENPAINENILSKRQLRELITTNITEEESAPYNLNSEILKAKEKNKQRGVPALPIKVQGGFSLHYNDPVYWSQLDRIYIPGLPYDGDDYLWAEMEGDSMEYTDERTGQLAGIQDRVWCIYQKVPQEFWRTGLRKFYVHLIITRTGLFTVKRILQDNPDEIVLSPDNPLYNQERIHLSEVLAIYIFKRKLDWNAPPPRQIEINV